MNFYKTVLEYVNIAKEDEPIFIEEIKKYVFEKVNENFSKSNSINQTVILENTNTDFYRKLNNNIKAILNRMKNDNIICQAGKGVYYKPTKTIWGRNSVSPLHKIREYKYLINKDGNIKGYITGAKLFNMLGLTTQIPKVIDIVTNECPNNNKYFIKRYNIIIRKPKILINNDNYKYLQLLDVLSNKDKINIEVDNSIDIIREYMDENKLSFEKLLKYARETNNKKVLTKIWELAR